MTTVFAVAAVHHCTLNHSDMYCIQIDFSLYVIFAMFKSFVAKIRIATKYEVCATLAYVFLVQVCDDIYIYIGLYTCRP